ncbi:cysteine proteinase [Pseudovirgaria hyperparasitica]|uniref:ubiquitinyl hydrolase 1 n=1 Tax=Pseudovirgaria hyperparasitica TaxID=470096 RepID=A0A6A6W991_9PEZI|nr:cysteine proteinase [Pseudovirgaria hyperparasitica]KAF2758157.1 cysteine proteinase [Pseudovirgaria hyperparasitica]
MAWRPGKTAPRLLEDLLTYDPRNEAVIGRNTLTDAPPVFDPEKSSSHTRYNGCRHAFMEKTEQSKLPDAGRPLEKSEKYKIATYCNQCRFHFDVTVDYSGQLYHGSPCPNNEFPLHHFTHVPSKENDKAGPSLSPQDSTYHFRCTAKDCPVEVYVRSRPPMFKTSWVDLLTNVDGLRARLAAAKSVDPNRALDINLALPWDGMQYLRKYIVDSLSPEVKHKMIPARNVKFMAAFGSDCDHVLLELGFVRVEAEDSNELKWRLPQCESSIGPFQADSHRSKLLDILAELDSLLLKRASSEIKQMKFAPPEPRPCLKDLERALGCLDYPKDPASRHIANKDIPEHPFYGSLGVLSDFSDQLVIFAYKRQIESDPSNTAYYFECIEDLAKGRNSETLATEVQILASQGQVNRKQVRQAYKYFNIDPDMSQTSDTFIINQYRARLADVSSNQERDMREMLRILGSARQSNEILHEASNSLETYAQALSWLDVQDNIADEFIVTMATIKLEDSGSQENARKAVRIIAEHRNSDALRIWLETGQLGHTEMDLAEAYRILDISDRTQEIDQGSLSVLFEVRMTDSSHPPAKLQEAYALISKSKFGMNEETSQHPPGNWPVGFQNIGNTCYLNSLLQYFFTIRPLRELVLNFDKYKLELTAENITKKRVGGREVSVVELEKAQEFVQELKKLFTGMITSTESSVRPEVRLACLALLSTGDEALQRRHSINNRGAGLGETNGTPFIGPMPMPTTNGASSPPQTETGDNKSDSTLVGDGSTPASSTEETDDALKAKDIQSTDLDAGVTEMDVSDADKPVTNGAMPAEPNRPPPVPPRPKAADTASTNVPADVEWAARQQDVAEVMNKVLFQLQCAIRPEVMSDGQVSDLTRRLFFGETTTTRTRNNKIERKKETWDTLFVNVNEGPRDIYKALDEEFDKGDIEEIKQDADHGILSKYENISVLPPVVQVNVKRVNYDTKKRETFKSHNHLHLEDTLFLDRYLEQTASVSAEELYSRRVKSWEWKKRLRVLQSRLQELKGDADSGELADTIEVTAEYLSGQEEEDEEESSQMAVDGESERAKLVAALRKRATELRHERDAIGDEIVELQDKIEGLFSDLQDHPYKLHAIFMHRGSAGGGHYWVYIRDFQNNMWRKYNDTKVDEVTNLQEIFGEDKTKPPATSTGVVYVQEGLSGKLTEAVCRQMAGEQEDVEMVDVIAGAGADTDADAEVIEGVEP